MATDHGAHGAGDHGPINHETTDIHLDGVGKITIGFVVFMALVILAMYGAFQVFAGRDAAGQREVAGMARPATPGTPALLSAPNTMEGGRMPAGPALLTNEPLNLRGFREAQSTRLTSYGWVDRAANVVHMPIERAIALTAERGLPVAAVPEPVTEVVDETAAATPEGESR